LESPTARKGIGVIKQKGPTVSGWGGGGGGGRHRQQKAGNEDGRGKKESLGCDNAKLRGSCLPSHGVGNGEPGWPTTPKNDHRETGHKSWGMEKRQVADSEREKGQKRRKRWGKKPTSLPSRKKGGWIVLSKLLRSTNKGGKRGSASLARYISKETTNQTNGSGKGEKGARQKAVRGAGKKPLVESP